MYESGNRLPRPEIMESIASLFGRTVQFIFFRE
jgi:DNA-binding XRE family transcriptional regulator